MQNKKRLCIPQHFTFMIPFCFYFPLLLQRNLICKIKYQKKISDDRSQNFASGRTWSGHTGCLQSLRSSTLVRILTDYLAPVSQRDQTGLNAAWMMWDLLLRTTKYSPVGHSTSQWWRVTSSQLNKNEQSCSSCSQCELKTGDLGLVHWMSVSAQLIMAKCGKVARSSSGQRQNGGNVSSDPPSSWGWVQTVITS